MEPEPLVSEANEPEQIVPQIVNDSEKQVHPDVSETPVHLAENIKIEQQQESANYQEENHQMNDVPKSTSADSSQAVEHLSVQPGEGMDNASSDGCEASDASAASVVRAEASAPPVENESVEKPTESPQEESSVIQNGHPAVSPSEETSAVPLVVLAQRSVEQQNGTHPVEQEESERIQKEESSHIKAETSEVESTAEQQGSEITVQKGVSEPLSGQMTVDPSDFILPMDDEKGKVAVIPSVTIDPVSGEEITVTSVEIPTEDKVALEQDTKTETKPELLKSASTNSIENAASGKRKRRRRFHFSLHRPKDLKREETRKADSLDRTSQRSFGTSVKHIWDNFSKSLKRREKSPEPPKKQKVRPPRPPPVTSKVDGKYHPHGNELDQQSLQSMSAVSISESPTVARKHLIQQALPDFIEALPSDQMEVSAQYNLNSEQQRILSWTAQQVAGNAADEAAIQPAYKQGPYHSSGYGRMSAGYGYSSPKPPRPTSPPTLSPLDYQPYHSEDGLSQSGLVQRRMDLLQSMTPTESDMNIHVQGSPVVARAPTAQMSGMNRPLTTSLDRREMSGVGYPGSPTIRRAQTLRTDYASRLRERVLSLRVEPGESQGEGGTLRPRKSRLKKETYVCSDTIKIPKLSFKLNRKPKEKPPAVVRPEKVIPRPHPNFVCATPEDKSSWSQPRITGNFEPMLSKIGAFVSNRPPTGFGPQMTSLPSMEGHYYDGPRYKRIEAALDAREYNSTSTPYISGEMRNQLDQQLESKQLEEVLKLTQPFLTSWDSREAENKERVALPDSLTHVVECIRSFLNTCVRLRAADLQGHFSPFQYQLATFDPICWKNVARFSNWSNLLIVSGAEGTTEYLQMVSHPQSKPESFYATRPVDIMLTNWLDRHHSNPQMFLSQRHQFPQVTYQPISFVSNLNKLISINPFSEQAVNSLFQLGLRLAVLLTYEGCLNEMRTSGLDEKFEPETNLDEIIIGWSTCNCVTVFHYKVKPERNEASQAEAPQDAPVQEEASKKEDGPESDIDTPASGTKAPEEPKADVDKLLQALCPEYESVDKAIDGIIDKVHATVTEQLNPEGIESSLLKSIAPPDWMALMVARIALHKM